MKVNVVNHCDATTGEDIHKSSTIELFDVNVCIGGVGPVIEMLEADPTLAERLPFIKAHKEAKAPSAGRASATPAVGYSPTGRWKHGLRAHVMKVTNTDKAWSARRYALDL